MTTSTQYRKFAEECDHLARAAKTEHHRKMLEDMARVWRILAEEAGRTDAERTDAKTR
jgi:hypothetical protein